jgi:hypothetical protein
MLKYPNAKRNPLLRYPAWKLCLAVLEQSMNRSIELVSALEEVDLENEEKTN